MGTKGIIKYFKRNVEKKTTYKTWQIATERYTETCITQTVGKK